MGGGGVGARDSVEQVVRGLNWRIRSDDIETLEAFAIFEGTKLTTDKGWKSDEIESNSQVLITQFKGGTSH